MFVLIQLVSRLKRGPGWTRGVSDMTAAVTSRATAGRATKQVLCRAVVFEAVFCHVVVMPTHPQLGPDH